LPIWIPVGRHNKVINTVVGEHYLIERELGRDQFGAVYMARDVRWRAEIMPVAVRIFDPKLTRLPGFLERFTQIAPILQSLDQLYINRVLSHGIIRDVAAGTEFYFLVTEPPGTQTLDAYLQQNRHQLNPEQIATLFERITAGVDFAHRHNIFHANLNLWNITMRSNGTEVIPEIADMGMMQMLLPYDLSELEKVTRWNMAIGIPEYLAPERFRGQAPAKSNDVYALGAILYFILSGRAPFQGNYEQLIVAHNYQQPPLLGPTVRHGPELHQMLLRPLAKVPPDRISLQDICIRYRQITGLPRGMLPVFETHPTRPAPPFDSDKKRTGWFKR